MVRNALIAQLVPIMARLGLSTNATAALMHVAPATLRVAVALDRDPPDSKCAQRLARWIEKNRHAQSLEDVRFIAA